MAQELFPHTDSVTVLLNQVLADEFVLYTKTLNAHWNCTGANFFSVHKLLDEQYNELQSVIDEVAERVRANTGVAIGSLKQFIELSRIPDATGVVSTKDLLADHELLIKNLREDITAAGEDFGDAATEDLLTSLLNRHLSMAWMLRSLQ